MIRGTSHGRALIERERERERERKRERERERERERKLIQDIADSSFSFFSFKKLWFDMAEQICMKNQVLSPDASR